MKKSNAQAERHSNRAGAPRTSRPRTKVFEQKHTANQMDHDALHLRSHAERHSKPDGAHALHLRSTIFFLFLFRLQAQAHSKRRGQPRTSSPPPPSFKNRLQAQASYALYV